MPEITLTVTRKGGLCSRPSAIFVRVAQRFQCDVKVSSGDRAADGKSILSLLSLGAGFGDEILLRAEGADSEAALDAIQKLNFFNPVNEAFEGVVDSFSMLDRAIDFCISMLRSDKIDPLNPNVPLITTYYSFDWKLKAMGDLVGKRSIDPSTPDHFEELRKRVVALHWRMHELIPSWWFPGTQEDSATKQETLLSFQAGHPFAADDEIPEGVLECARNAQALASEFKQFLREFLPKGSRTD